MNFLIKIFITFFISTLTYFSVIITSISEELKSSDSLLLNSQCEEALVFYEDRPELHTEYLVLLKYCNSAGKKIKTLIYPENFDINPIISDFKSMNGVNGRNRMNIHQGVDIIGGKDQAIIAVADGRVLETVIEKCWGPTVVIDHGKSNDGKNLITIYGHVGEIVVKENDLIKRGDLIARLPKRVDYRCMGRVRHLHFQIGQKYCEKEEKNSWGCNYFIKDYFRSLNPHLYWAAGPNKITCFEKNKLYEKGTLTYPLPCRKNN